MAKKISACWSIANITSGGAERMLVLIYIDFNDPANEDGARPAKEIAFVYSLLALEKLYQDEPESFGDESDLSFSDLLNKMLGKLPVKSDVKTDRVRGPAVRPLVMALHAMKERSEEAVEEENDKDPDDDGGGGHLPN